MASELGCQRVAGARSYHRADAEEEKSSRPEMAPESFSRWEHLRLRREFVLVYRQGLRVHRRSFTIHVRPNGLGYNRLGLSIGRKLGCAVRRNRIKRRLRDIFRRNKRPLAGGVDLVINGRSVDGLEDYQTLKKEFLGAVEHARRRLESPRSQPPASAC